MMNKKFSRRNLFRYAAVVLVGTVITAYGVGNLFGSQIKPEFQAAAVVSADGRGYQDIVTQEFIPRNLAALNGIRNSLIAAGVPANAVTVSMPDTNDMRWQIEAKRGNRDFIGYIELTDASHSLGNAGRGRAIFTFWLEGNGIELTTTYTPGGHQSYIDSAGLDSLLAKLAQLEATVPEAAVKIRAFLGL